MGECPIRTMQWKSLVLTFSSHVPLCLYPSIGVSVANLQMTVIIFLWKKSRVSKNTTCYNVWQCVLDALHSEHLGKCCTFPIQKFTGLRRTEEWTGMWRDACGVKHVAWRIVLACGVRWGVPYFLSCGAHELPIWSVR